MSLEGMLFRKALVAWGVVVVFVGFVLFFVSDVGMRSHSEAEARVIFEKFQSDVIQHLREEHASWYSQEGSLEKGTDLGVSPDLLRVFFESKSGLFWVDGRPYLYEKDNNRVVVMDLQAIYNAVRYPSWNFFFLEKNTMMVAYLGKQEFAFKGLEEFVRAHEEAIFLSQDTVAIRKGVYFWLSRMVAPNVILVGVRDYSQWIASGMRMVCVIAAGFLLLLVIFLGLQMSFWRQWKKAWKEVMTGVKRFEKQDYHYRILLEKDAPLEVNQMAAAFNNLAETLEASYYANDKLFQQLRYNYYHDKLTGLPNGDKFLEDFNSFEHPNFMLFDIQDFSEWNMYFGSQMGDRVLAQTAQRLSSFSLYPKTSIYKLWADRFLLVIDQEMERRELEVIATYFLENLSNLSYEVGGEEVYLTFVAGILGSSFLSPGVEGNAVLTSLAGLLKKAKGMKTYFFIAEDIQSIAHQTEQNLQTLGKVRDAIQHSHLVNFYQPIINNQTKKIEKYEALVRIQLPSGEMIPPLVFLSLAKQAKLYSFISRAVVHHALEHFRYLPYEVSINFSPEDLFDKKLQHFLITAFSAFKDPSRIVLEITETESIENYEALKDALEPFLALGCRLAIDDFGSGYSNFYHIFSLKPHYIKVDGSLIKNIDKDETSYALVKSICQFARELGAKTVAEFVHHEVVWKKVVELGIDYSQGFYFSPPQPYDKLFGEREKHGE